MPGPAAIPIIMGGIAAARLVGPKLAESLISRGLAKKATGDVAKLAKKKVKSGAVKEINQVKDLPTTVQDKMKFGIKKAQQKSKPSPSNISKESNTAAQNRARVQRMQEQEAKQKAIKAEARAKARAEKPQIKKQKTPEEIEHNKLLSNPAYWNYLNKASNKIKNQARVTASPRTPRLQKGMRFARKSETTKRQDGGKVMSGSDLVSSLYD
tara:strand:+ start:513 stop:1145 length:633 start_codon:yes stop_codon:yes gene_type:complete